MQRRLIPSCFLAVAAMAGIFAVVVAETVPLAKAQEEALARSQGQSLARRQVDGAIDFLEFLAGARFSSDERRAIREEARQEFFRDPAGALSGYALIEDTLERLRAFNGDKVKEAELRENAIAAIHLQLLSRPPEESDDAAVEALFRRVPVLAADQEAGVVITKLGLDALLDANDFVAVLAGHDKMGAGERKRIRAEVAAAFTEISADERSILAHGLSRWTRLQVFWSGLQAGERAAVAEELRRKASRSADVPVAARQLETTARLALFGQRLDRNVAEILRVQNGATVLHVMRDQSKSFGD